LPQTLEPLLRAHKFFAGLRPEYVALLVGCASTAVFAADSYLFREGEPAETFYLIRDGKVALEIAAPGRGALTVQTLAAGDVAGFSWLIEPHRWQFDGRAVERVLAVRMDAACLRRKAEQDPAFGYEFILRFSRLTVARLQATRLQLLDVYGHGGTSPPGRITVADSEVGPLPDPVRPELDADPRACGARGLGDGVLPGALAAAPHDEQVAVPDAVAQRAVAPALVAGAGDTGARTEQQRSRGTQ
jgi:CRP/FNR family transcriptional regulator, cyclic AMP receptor protein